MVVEITYFCHATSEDNEMGIATGWNEGKLSKKGREEAENLAKLISDQEFDIVFCSDLMRARETAEIVFGNKIPIQYDWRLRECNYGIYTGAKSSILKKYKKLFINKKFPGGESYLDVQSRIEDLLKYIKEKYDNKKIAFVSHQGPQLALEVITKKVEWEKAMDNDWRNRKEWQPGWYYIY